MQVPVQVTFRDMPVSDAVEAACWDEAAKLERCCNRIASCRIVVAESAGRPAPRHAFEIRIVLNVPGRELATLRTPPDPGADEDVYDAIRDAFEITRRQLEEYVHDRV